MKTFSKDETDFKLNLNNDEWYVKSELNNLNKESELFTIQIHDFEGNKTRNFTLNSESIKVLTEFINRAGK